MKRQGKSNKVLNVALFECASYAGKPTLVLVILTTLYWHQCPSRMAYGVTITGTSALGPISRTAYWHQCPSRMAYSMTITGTSTRSNHHLGPTSRTVYYLLLTDFLLKGRGTFFENLTIEVTVMATGEKAKELCLHVFLDCMVKIVNMEMVVQFLT